jgi:hypothetical protein
MPFDKPSGLVLLAVCSFTVPFDLSPVAVLIHLHINVAIDDAVAVGVKIGDHDGVVSRNVARLDGRVFQGAVRITVGDRLRRRAVGVEHGHIGLRFVDHPVAIHVNLRRHGQPVCTRCRSGLISQHPVSKQVHRDRGPASVRIERRHHGLTVVDEAIAIGVHIGGF